jgi:transposase
MAVKKGLQSRAVGFMPAKSKPEEQRAYVESTLLPLIESAKNGLSELFFMDASHFVMGGFPGRVWSTVRRYVKTGSGRKRYNVLGALNYITKKVETVCNDTYITSTQVVEMFEKLAAAYKKPIHIIMDNASYQRCAFVQAAGKRLGITVHYLPTYSPNLNLIERVWKLVKAKVLNAAYYETYEVFCKNVSACVDTLNTISIDDMTRLVTAKFHIIDENLVVNK